MGTAGADPLRFNCQLARVPNVPSDATASPDPGELDDSALEAAQDALHDARSRLIEVPAEYVVANHVMGLYELAAIHLSNEPPSLPQAALAIDAVGCLVEGLGDRLGPDAETLRTALANIRLAFVQIKGKPSG